MCGKFIQMKRWAVLTDFAHLVAAAALSQESEFELRTPMRFADVIRLDESGQRECRPMRWGFADRYATVPQRQPRHMHARAETIDSLPTFAGAFAQARGLVVVKSFNVGEELPNGKVKQWVVTPRDGNPIALAAIWERWTHPNEDELLTFVMVTVPTNPLLAAVTDRMPAVIAPQDWPAWLGETPASATELKEMLLAPVEADWDLSEQVNPRSARPKETRQFDLF
ncbi:MAG TPA: SOS response-associated peptidase family protein [Rhizomicrobium sp.]|jgi:putative SOS response-associated peptidase YedK